MVSKVKDGLRVNVTDLQRHNNNIKGFVHELNKQITEHEDTLETGSDEQVRVIVTSCMMDSEIQKYNFKVHQLYGPRQANLVLIAYASSEGSGEPAHPRSLARTSAARSYKQWVKRNLQTESQIPGPSEWLGMRS